MTKETQTTTQTTITTIGIADGRDALIQLVIKEGHNPEMISSPYLQSLADRLCAFAPKTGRKAKWGRDYLDNVLKGRLDPSTALFQAVMAMMQTIAGTPDVWAMARPMQLSVSASVKPGALVAVNSRDCAFAACGRPFIPVNFFQRYCSPECRERRKQARGK
jgi:hypothetical protein